MRILRPATSKATRFPCPPFPPGLRTAPPAPRHKRGGIKACADEWRRSSQRAWSANSPAVDIASSCLRLPTTTISNCSHAAQARMEEKNKAPKHNGKEPSPPLQRGGHAQVLILGNHAGKVRKSHATTIQNGRRRARARSQPSQEGRKTGRWSKRRCTFGNEPVVLGTKTPFDCYESEKHSLFLEVVAVSGEVGLCVEC